MSDTPKEKKYQFDSKVRLPNMQEILDAASDFTPPSEKKMEEVKDKEAVAAPKKLDIKELTRQSSMSAEQAELQKLGDAVADAEIRRAKEKERQRAEELRRLCKEREEEAQKKADEARKVADEERRKAIEAAREKANARKEAEAAAAEKARAEQEAADAHSDMELNLDDLSVPPIEDLPPIAAAMKAAKEKAEAEAREQSEKKADESSASQEKSADVESFIREESEAVDAYISGAFAENPFDDKPKETKPKEKEEFKETVLEDDYKDEMDLREDTSESVDDDFLDF